MRRMTGAWLIFCLIALPKMIGSFHNSDFRFPPPDPSGTVRQNVPHTNDFPPENSASVRDKLPARFLDEPFVGIDPIAVQELQTIIKKLRDSGLGILITDHTVRETLNATDRAYLMYEGRILRSGTARDLADDPEARRIYLGENFRL